MKFPLYASLQINRFEHKTEALNSEPILLGKYKLKTLTERKGTLNADSHISVLQCILTACGHIVYTSLLRGQWVQYQIRNKYIRTYVENSSSGRYTHTTGKAMFPKWTTPKNFTLKKIN